MPGRSAIANIGKETNNQQVGSESNQALALAQRCAGTLSAARAAGGQAQQYNYPPATPHVLALLGLIALRENDLPAAREAFTAALAHAEGLLAHTSENYAALDANALALAGLGDIEKARAAYRAARAINSDPGIVRRATRLLGQLLKGFHLTNGDEQDAILWYDHACQDVISLRRTPCPSRPCMIARASISPRT